MNSKLFVILIGIVLLAFMLVFSMTYSVRFNEVAIVTTFGEAGADDIRKEPGLALKLPAPIQSVKTYDTRIQTVDTRLETHATSDGLQVIVQAFVLWSVDADNVLAFDQAYGSLDAAGNEIEARMRSAVGALSAFEFSDLIGEDNQLGEVEDRIQARLVASGGGSRSLAELGVRIEEVGLSQILLPVETSKNVVERMKKEMDEQAGAIRQGGDSAALAIESEARRQADAIIQHAERLAAKIRAQGDTLAESSVAVLAQDEEFSTFLLWIDALRQIASDGTTFFLPTTIEPLHLLNFDEYGDGIPQPRREFGPAGSPPAPAAERNAGPADGPADQDQTDGATPSGS